MRTGRHIRGASLKTWLLLLALGSGLGAQERPLPEVAREKPGKTATRVLTNEDLEAERPREALPSSPSPGAGAEAVPGKKERERAGITVPGLLENATASEARAILKSLQHDEEVLLRRYAQIEEKLSHESDQHLRQLYSNSLMRRDETLARKRAQLLQVQKAIEAGESHRASAPEVNHDRESEVRK
ncbi:MAG TPA: hypothetical protein VLC12_09085 [Terriglobales bacterium]|nr:hypothetical protein [Terriglobales bacterium]